MAVVNIALRYISYKLFAGHKYGHGIHSPFVFGLIRNVFVNDAAAAPFKKIELKRKEYLRNKRKIEGSDYGAGSKTSLTTRVRSLRSIVRSSSVSKKYGKMLFRLVNYYNPDMIAEFGTSAGIGTLYLALANKNKKVITIEGNKHMAEVAAASFQEFNLQNIEILNDTFDNALPGILKSLAGKVMFYIDGNHQKEAVLKYFRHCCNYSGESLFVFDDINWSEEMYEAWKLIRSDDQTKISIYLFRMGIVVNGEKYQKQNYVIKY